MDSRTTVRYQKSSYKTIRRRTSLSTLFILLVYLRSRHYIDIMQFSSVSVTKKKKLK